MSQRQRRFRRLEAQGQAPRVESFVMHDACPVCKTPVERGVFAAADQRPEPGALSICYHCHCVTVYGHDLKLRLATEAEAMEIANDPETRAALDHVAGNLDAIVRAAELREAEGN